MSRVKTVLLIFAVACVFVSLAFDQAEARRRASPRGDDYDESPPCHGRKCKQNESDQSDYFDAYSRSGIDGSDKEAKSDKKGESSDADKEKANDQDKSKAGDHAKAKDGQEKAKDGEKDQDKSESAKSGDSPSTGSRQSHPRPMRWGRK